MQPHHTSIPVPLIAVYCGSRMGNHPIYQQTAIKLAHGLVEHGFGIVYGGASIGIMGEIANAALAKQGIVVGVIPEFMLDYEVAHQSLTQLHIVPSMHVRKAMMADLACAFITLPGGFGTLEEILEIATWAQLQQHQKPMILINTNGYYDALIAQLDHAVAEGFLQTHHREKICVCNDAEAAFKQLKQHALTTDVR